ncbi:uncharacterized protein LOC130494302 isoform X2 [Raphanus sativus]|uniref:Uncharacterized protein LOC108848617 isoform X2 n=1 Tax=Raphanus sativus TaxID=3726 RepID=A0A6J0MYJ5_RAPSA|nr:uncharacterized protein LOC108848617 isoform X2 [Raphanus sativus]XP_056856748.1 uncharacterized protein LOC130494302 isoform X2 [Raphanus sativus]
MKAPKMPLQIVHFNIACVVSQTSSLIMAIFQLQPKPMESFRFWNYEQLIVLANTNTDCPGRSLAKEDGIVAGIPLAEMIFEEVDLSLKVEWMRKDGDYVHKGFLRQKKTASGLRLVDK